MNKKAIRLFQPGVYSLDLTNNFIDSVGISIICLELFKVDDKPIQQFENTIQNSK